MAKANGSGRGGDESFQGVFEAVVARRFEPADAGALNDDALRFLARFELSDWHPFEQRRLTQAEANDLEWAALIAKGERRRRGERRPAESELRRWAAGLAYVVLGGLSALLIVWSLAWAAGAWGCPLLAGESARPCACSTPRFLFVFGESECGHVAPEDRPTGP